MARKRVNAWLNPDMKAALKIKAVQMQKPLLDLSPEDLRITKKKQEGFKFRV